MLLFSLAGLEKNRHTVVEAIPVPRDRVEDCRIHFKQAFDEATSDWSAFHSKRIIETDRKGLQDKIPPNFPYLFVEFDLGRGFLHVLANEHEYSNKFFQSILQAAVLSHHDHNNNVKKFLSKFKPYDWTAQLL